MILELETTQTQLPEVGTINVKAKPDFPVKVLKGKPACKGQVSGRIFLVNAENIADFPAGWIMVANKTTPEFTSAFSRASGVITEVGGILSHAAIVSREHNIPCVVGVSGLITYARPGQEVTLNADTGEVSLVIKPSLYKKTEREFLFPGLGT